MVKILTIVLIISLITTVFPQDYSSFNKSTVSFFDSVEQFTKDFNRENATNILESTNFSDSVVERLLKSYYNVKANDPVGFHKYELLKREEFEKNYNPQSNELMLPEKIGIIYRIISSKYGKQCINLLLIPWYLKVKILDFNFEPLHSPKGQSFKNYVLAEVQEVVKGVKFYSVGQTIKIYYKTQWMQGKQFKKNNSYFVALHESNCQKGDCANIGLGTFPDDNGGVYQIENNEINAPNNYFGFKDKITWSEFKNEFVKKYLIK